MDWYTHFKRICKTPRQPNKAKAFWVSNKRLEKTFSWFDPYRADSIKIQPIDTSDTDDVVQSLKSDKKKVKEGDVVIFEAFLRAECMGIFIFDLLRLYPLTWKVDGVGKTVFTELVVTDEVQCIAGFPIHWWDDFPFMSKMIPFNVFRHLPDLDVKDVRLLHVFDGVDKSRGSNSKRLRWFK